MAVPSTVGSASPFDWKLAVTPVFCWKAFRTWVKLCCSEPDQTAHTVTLPPTFCWLVPVALGPLLPPPHAASSNDSRATATTPPAARRPHRIELMADLHACWETEAIPSDPADGA